MLKGPSVGRTGTDPRRTAFAYMQGLQREREKLCRKWDRKAFDAFSPDRYIARHNAAS